MLDKWIMTNQIKKIMDKQINIDKGNLQPKKMGIQM